MDQFRIYVRDRGTLIPVDLARSLFALRDSSTRSDCLLQIACTPGLQMGFAKIPCSIVHLELSYHFVSQQFFVSKSLSGGGPIRVGRCIIAFTGSSCGHLVQNQQPHWSSIIYMKSVEDIVDSQQRKLLKNKKNSCHPKLKLLGSHQNVLIKRVSMIFFKEKLQYCCSKQCINSASFQ